MSDDLQPIVRGAERLLFELARIDRAGPAMVIVHRFRIRVFGAECQAGEEVFQIFLSHCLPRTEVHLPLAQRLLFDYLARTKHSPQNATQIAAGMRAAAFYRRHGMNSGVPSTRKISRSYIREYVKRIRRALENAFHELSLPLESRSFLVSHAVGNEVRYQLKASIEWVHAHELDERLPLAERGM